MGGEQAATVLATVRRDGIEAKGGTWSAEEEEAFKAPIRERYEHEGHPYFASARIWDDGIIDPADTRRVLAHGDIGVAQPADRADDVRRVQDVTRDGCDARDAAAMRPTRPRHARARAAARAGRALRRARGRAARRRMGARRMRAARAAAPARRARLARPDGSRSVRRRRTSIALTNFAFAEALSRSTYGGFVVTVLVHTDMASPHLVRAGTRCAEGALAARRSSRGEIVTAIAVTEANAGSDVARIRTTARRDGADWVLDGSKMFITNGVHADLYFVAARTAPLDDGIARRFDVHRREGNAGIRGRAGARQVGLALVGHGRARVRRLPHARREPARRGERGLSRADAELPARAARACRDGARQRVVGARAGARARAHRARRSAACCGSARRSGRSSRCSMRAAAGGARVRVSLRVARCAAATTACARFRS